MTDEAQPARRSEKALGRRRDPSRTTAILEAAATLLLEVGYDRFRIQDVAERAGSGTGAIYRRWSSKEALVAEAIRNMPVTQPKSTPDPVADLRALVRLECDGFASNPDRVPGLISAMRSDAGIENAVRAGYNYETLRNGIARIIGADHPHLTLLSELAPAVSLLRASFAPDTLAPEAMTDEIMSLIQRIAASD